MVDLHRALAGRVARHGGERVLGRLDLGDDALAEPAADAAGVLRLAAQRDLARTHERLRVVFGAHPLGERRHAARPPGVGVAEVGEGLLERGAQLGAVVGGGEVVVEVGEALAAGLEGGLASLRAAMPGLEVAEDGGELGQRMGGGVGDGGVGALRPGSPATSLSSGRR